MLGFGPEALPLSSSASLPLPATRAVEVLPVSPQKSGISSMCPLVNLYLLSLQTVPYQAGCPEARNRMLPMIRVCNSFISSRDVLERHWRAQGHSLPWKSICGQSCGFLFHPTKKRSSNGQCLACALVFGHSLTRDPDV